MYRRMEDEEGDNGGSKSFTDLIRLATEGASLSDLEISYANGVRVSIHFPTPPEGDEE